jgi:rare lipoprotein A
MPSSAGYKKRGIASWYGSKFQGKRTSSGELYDMHKMTAAHKTLPLPTYVKVTNLKNNRHVILKVNDRGPFHDNRIIDLSHTAAVKLGIKATGTGLVEVEAIDPNKTQVLTTATPNKVAQTPPISGVGLFLQLGAFVDAHNAYQLKNRANTHLSSYQAKVSSTISNGQKFYRVRIGPLEHAEQADSLAQKLHNAGFAQARIVIE